MRQEAADGDLRPGCRLHHSFTAPAPVTAAVCCLSNAGAGPGVIKQSVASRQHTQHPVSTLHGQIYDVEQYLEYPYFLRPRYVFTSGYHV